jgi:SRSO17 transposase
MSDLERKSLEPIALHLSGEKEVRLLQHYFQKGKWDEVLMLTLYQKRLLSVIATESPENDICTFDESGIPKKGNESAGVCPQYCGNLGKVANCQVGVFMGYGSSKGYGFYNGQLFIPQVWFSY